jgi:hypothetical protein
MRDTWIVKCRALTLKAINSSSFWGSLISLMLIGLIGVCSGIVPAYGNAVGPVLPNAKVTPGDINPVVNQGNLKTTICSAGYISKIKPTTSFLNKIMIAQLTTLPYSGYGDRNVKHFEEDLLIPLELGGSATSTKNLWPEPIDLGFGDRTKDFGARTKDLVEAKLHTLVCSGSLSLKSAQKSIATDWWASYQKYVVSAAPRTTPTPSSTPQPTASPTNASSHSPSTKISEKPIPTPTPNPTEYAVIPTTGDNFLMPQLGLKNINVVLANWSKFGFKVQPSVQVMPPLYDTDTCLPWKGSKGLAGVIASFSPVFNDEVGPEALVTITLNCEERGDLNTSLQITQP